MYKCECGKIYDSIESLYAHRYRCSIGKEFYLKEKEIEKNFLNNNTCECGKVFVNNRGLIQHVLHCKNCSRKFYDLFINKSFKIKSSDVFECSVCNKRFNTLRGLSLHSTKSGHALSDEQISKRKHNFVNTSGKYQCKICNKKYNKCSALHIHLKIHNILDDKDLLQYYVNYENVKVPKCEFCGNELKLKSFTKDGPTFRTTCCDKQCIKKHSEKVQKDVYINHPEKREERRIARMNYLKKKENFVNTAWGKRAIGELSYIEQWFYDNVILVYSLQKSYEIVNEYHFCGYAFDYAFPDLKLDVELDGKVHFKDNKRIEHDIKRDEFIKSNGWKVYRIKYDEIKNDSKKVIFDFLSYLSSLK